MFWLTEDSDHPEPQLRLLKTFGAGALAALASIVLENIVSQVSGISTPTNNGDSSIFLTFGSIVVVIIWAAIEETTKFIAARNVALITPDDDEPLDPLIYMITAALGFAAMENTLFLISPLIHQGITAGIVSVNLRFLGATLVHTISSGVLGLFMSFCFYSQRTKRTVYIVLGLIAATTLHALFNLAIIKADRNIIPIFGLVWMCVIVLLYMIEKVKALHKN